MTFRASAEKCLWSQQHGRCPEHRLPEQRGHGKGAKDTGRARVGTILQYDEKNGIDIIPDGE